MTKSWKNCGKRRNCSSWAISSFAKLFSKVVCFGGICIRVRVKNIVIRNNISPPVATTFSPLFNNSILIYGLDVFPKSFFYPLPHTTILQQTTFNSQKIENRLKVENIVAKGEIARFEQFLLLSLFSKSCLLQRRQIASMRERVNKIQMHHLSLIQTRRFLMPGQ